jgi:hypothetical protein
LERSDAVSQLDNFHEALNIFSSGKWTREKPERPGKYLVRARDVLIGEHFIDVYIDAAGALRQTSPWSGWWWSVQFPVLPPTPDRSKEEPLSIEITSRFLLIGRKGNVWSDQAERLLREYGVNYRFQRMKAPPHPHPEQFDNGDPLIMALPTLLLDYSVEDDQGEEHWVRSLMATGIEEIEEWVRISASVDQLVEDAVYVEEKKFA